MHVLLFFSLILDAHTKKFYFAFYADENTTQFNIVCVRKIYMHGRMMSIACIKARKFFECDFSMRNSTLSQICAIVY